MKKPLVILGAMVLFLAGAGFALVATRTTKATQNESAGIELDNSICTVVERDGGFCFGGEVFDENERMKISAMCFETEGRILTTSELCKEVNAATTRMALAGCELLKPDGSEQQQRKEYLERLLDVCKKEALK